MNKVRSIFLFVVFCLFFQNLKSQYYSSGADPAHVKWHKIETENFKVVFSEEFTLKGQYIAKVLEEVYRYGGYSLNHKPKKISVLVHNETAYSNGFVTWAPKRIELYSTPNQNMHAQEWLQQLAIHEFRHVVQIDKMNDGFTKMLSYILGEQAIGGVLGLYVPLWFLEGDAVVAETTLTPSGRGRSPWFEQGMRAQIMDKKLYSYEKASFGSYKDFVPNHYEFGYQLVAGARAKYGSEIWESALFHSGRSSFCIFAFNKGQKKVSDVNKIKLYSNTFDFLHQQWVQQDSLTQKTGYTSITKQSKEFKNFKTAVSIGEGNYIAEISGPGEINRFVQVSESGKYHTLFVPGSRSAEPFSFANNTICWAESEPDPRWENRTYSVIKCYDISRGKVDKVTRKSRFFAPSISPDGKSIVSVNADLQNAYSLVLMNRDDGKVWKRFKHGNNDYLFTPSWNSKGDKIVCIAMSDEGKSVVTLDFNTSKWEQITLPSYADISLPKWVNDTNIYFTAGYSGTEEIYKVNIQSKKVTQITQSKYGSTGVCAIGNKGGIAYSRYSADGYQLVKMDTCLFLEKSLENVEDFSVKLHEKISRQEIGRPDFSGIDEKPDYAVGKYSKWNLFKFHSWAPAFININDAEVNMGASALSQNLLGTAITSIGFNADPQLSREKYYFSFEYTGWYPVLKFAVKYGDEKIESYTNESGEYSLDANKYSLTQFEFGSYIPFYLTKGKYSNLLQPSVNYFMQYRSAYNVLKSNYQVDGGVPVFIGAENFERPDYLYNGIEYSLYYHHFLKRSLRDVTTRWGQLIELKYQHSPWGTIDAGSTLGVRTRLYFPGLRKYHSIRLDNNGQYKVSGDEYSSDSEFVTSYKFGDYYNFARGYGNFSNDQLYSFKADYIFPLWNPDITVPGLIYLKRITTNLFYDYTKTWQKFTYKSNETSFIQEKEYKSFGAEFRGEIHVFRFLYPITVGYRYARLYEFNQNKHELLLGFNISGFSLGEK